MGVVRCTDYEFKLKEPQIDPVDDMNDYVLLNTLGQGSFGKVKLAYDKHHPEKEYAIKLIEKIKLRKNSYEYSIRRECQIMTLLHHPNIAVCYEFFETNIYHCLVMEYVEGGELFDYVIQKVRLNEEEAQHLFRQLLSALIYCHKHHVMHRDLKMENLLIDHNKTLKIIDFGLSNMYSVDGINDSFVGTLHYMAPEIIARQKYSGELIDVWGAGCVLYVMLCGVFPFDEDQYSTNSKYEISQKIMFEEYEIPPKVVISADAIDLLNHCLAKNFKDRYNLQQLRHHIFVTKNSSILQDHVKTQLLPIVNPCATICERIEKLNFKDVAYSLQTSTESNLITSLYFLMLNQPVRTTRRKTVPRPAMTPRALTIPSQNATLTIPKNHSRNNSCLSLTLGYNRSKSMEKTSENDCEKDDYLQLLTQLIETLKSNNIEFQRVGQHQFICQELNETHPKSNRFEVQICHIPTKNKYTLKIKRIRGSLLNHQIIKKHILQSIKV